MDVNYKIAKIHELLKNKEMSNHSKILNIFLIDNNVDNIPKLPPQIIPCEITLKSGSKYRAYIDNTESGNWIEYGNSFGIRRNGRRRWSFEEVIKWEFL